MSEIDTLTPGSKQMLVSGNAALWPTNGRGGTQTGSAHSNFPATGTYLAEALTVQAVATAATAVQILEGDGATQLCSIPIGAGAATVIGQYIPIGGVYGYSSDLSNSSSSGPGISAKLSTADATFQATLWFRRVQ